MAFDDIFPCQFPLRITVTKNQNKLFFFSLCLFVTFYIVLFWTGSLCFELLNSIVLGGLAMHLRDESIFYRFWVDKMTRRTFHERKFPLWGRKVSIKKIHTWCWLFLTFLSMKCYPSRKRSLRIIECIPNIECRINGKIEFLFSLTFLFPFYIL